MSSVDSILSVEERTRRLDAEVSKLEAKGYEAIHETATTTIVQNEAGEQLRLDVDVFGQITIASPDGAAQSNETATGPVHLPHDLTFAGIGMPLAIIGCAVLVIIGSIGPWAKVWFVTASGTDGDGTFTLILGIAAAVMAGLLITIPARRGLLTIGLFGAFAAIAGIGIYDWQNISGVVDESELVTVAVGWGLQLVTISAIAGLIATGIQFSRKPKEILDMG